MCETLAQEFRIIDAIHQERSMMRAEIKLPNHDWQISHPSIGVQVQVFQKCGYPVALAFLANR